MTAPFRICFVCTGNICRSPMAEAVFRARLAEDGLDGLVEVDSAGTGGWHEGEGADPRTDAVLRAGGYEHVHAARQFDTSWFDHLDLVIALDSGHLRELRALAPTAQDAAKIHLLRSYGSGTAADTAPGPPPGLGAIGDLATADGLDVPDPYYGGIAGFEECLEMIEAASDGLLVVVRAAIMSRPAVTAPARGYAPGRPQTQEPHQPHPPQQKESA
ncbi:low molecular weight protein-tyrosine-phosphatase [Streptomyces sp. DSM 41527]|uniref:protein-tyrosine-phosphatase n=1 Tax=Streptomyces mooreae TaxID=3075523 RepID=A0ABU2T5T0_9ACTN|nr:low molecular weight protein-tyrosine-phosphatase [Streptomyces sp. DSM 41527]MDT0455609.1 low molecular weight protein-tyrosine-phosphatase [Streptomyces sp. DSM 41527]